MKQINLLPWRDQKNKLEKIRFIIIWFGVLSLCITSLFSTRILIIHQIKNYQLVRDTVLLHIKFVSSTVQEIKKLNQEEKALREIIKISQTNHQTIRKFLDFIMHVKYLATPDIFMRLIEFHQPYLRLLMSGSSKKEILTFIKGLQLKCDPKLQWVFLNISNDRPLDFIVNMKL